MRSRHANFPCRWEGLEELEWLKAAAKKSASFRQFVPGRLHMLQGMALHQCARDNADWTKWITTRGCEVGKGFDWGFYGELERKWGFLYSHSTLYTWKNYQRMNKI